MKLFISYSRADEVFVNRLCTDLKTRAIDVWLDRKDIAVGDSIPGCIESALSSVDGLCLVLSSASVSRPWVLREYHTALMRQLSSTEKGFKILPIRLDSATLPSLLSSIKYADFRNEYSAGLCEFLAAIGVKQDDLSPYGELVSHIQMTFGSVTGLVREFSKCNESINGIGYKIVEGTWVGALRTRNELRTLISRNVQLSLHASSTLGIGSQAPVVLISGLHMVSQPIEVSPDNYESYHGFCDGAEGFFHGLMNHQESILMRKVYLLPETLLWRKIRINSDDEFDESQELETRDIVVFIKES